MLDIKIPIGLMFTILGLLLTAFGLFTSSDAGLYDKAFGYNVNLWSGAGMLVFGALMLVLTRFGKKKV
jgi:hypothetical protein